MLHQLEHVGGQDDVGGSHSVTNDQLAQLRIQAFAAGRDPVGAAHQHAVADVPQHTRFVLLDHIAFAVQHLPHHVRPHHPAAVRQRGDGVQHLQRSSANESLSDYRIVGVAGRPALAQVEPLPLLVGNQARRFAGQVDAQRRTVSQGAGIVPHCFDSQAALRHLILIAAADLVEVHVARPGDPMHEVDSSVPFLLPAHKVLGLGRIVREVLVVDGDQAWIVQPTIWLDHAFVQRAQCGHHLERRSGWKGGGDGVVDQRLALVFGQLVEVILWNESRQQVVLVGRNRDHRQDLARLRIHGNHRSLCRAYAAGETVEEIHTVEQGGLRHRLQSGIDGELQVAARNRRIALPNLGKLRTGDVLLDQLQAVLAG